MVTWILAIIALLVAPGLTILIGLGYYIGGLWGVLGGILLAATLGENS